ncbi:hypothetical protein [Streptomyces sp. 2323.1]|uniref:hypothetical protein n=1 Tax=Streptomyces sp. 2323.1 TaxID=1938841 RepID=UPI000BB7EDDA
MVDDQEHAVKLGVFLSNTKTRRDKLTADAPKTRQHGTGMGVTAFLVALATATLVLGYGLSLG